MPAPESMRTPAFNVSWFLLRYDLPDNTIAVGAASKAIQRSVGPGTARGCQLINRSSAIGSVAVGRPVKIARCIQQQVAETPGNSPSWIAVEHGEGPTAVGGRQFENCAAAARAAFRCGPV